MFSALQKWFGDVNDVSAETWMHRFNMILGGRKSFFFNFLVTCFGRKPTYEISLSIQLGMLWNQAETVDPYSILQRFEDVGQEAFNMFYQLYYFFANLRMVRKTLSHRIALTVGRGLPPFSYVPRHQISRKSCLATLDEWASMLNPSLRVNGYKMLHDATCV